MAAFQNILALYSMRVGDEAALECTSRLARSTGARLEIVDVLYADDVSGCLIAERRKHLDRLAESVRHRGVRASTDVLLGRHDTELVRKAVRDGHDLVVLTDDRTQGLQELLFGSTGINVMKKCPCPVWLLKASSPPRLQKILALVAPPAHPTPDGLDAKILRHAAEVARALGANLHVLKVWDVAGPEMEILRAEAPAETKCRILNCNLHKHRTAVRELLALVDLEDVDHEVHLPQGDPHQTIPAFAQACEPDLVVVGWRARPSIADALFGCTAQLVLSKVDCAVLTVKPDGFVSPLALPGS